MVKKKSSFTTTKNKQITNKIRTEKRKVNDKKKEIIKDVIKNIINGEEKTSTNSILPKAQKRKIDENIAENESKKEKQPKLNDIDHLEIQEKAHSYPSKPLSYQFELQNDQQTFAHKNKNVSSSNDNNNTNVLNSISENPASNGTSLNEKCLCEYEEKKQQQQLKRRMSNRLAKIKQRSNLQYKEKDRKANAISKRNQRNDPQKKEQMKNIDKISKAKQRSNPEFQVKDRKANTTSKKYQRNDPYKKEQMKNVDKISKAKQRSNPVFKVKDQRANTISKKNQRNDPYKKEQMKNIDRISKAKQRTNPEFQMKDQKANTTSKRIRRKKPEIKKEERIYDKLRKSKNRQNLKIKIATNQTIREIKKRNRNNDLLNYRESYISRLQAKTYKNDIETKAKLKFLMSREDQAEFICTSCEGLFFQHYVHQFNKIKMREHLNRLEKRGKVIEYNSIDLLLNKIESYDSEYIFKTCYNTCKNGKLPKSYTNNGFKFPKIPENISRLNDAEATMVSPWLPFKKIIPCKPHALNSQLSLKGSVVNIPIKVQNMVKVLPRPFDNMDTIQLKLKRRMEHKTEYINEIIRPNFIHEAMLELLKTPLYQKYNITIDEEYQKCYEAYYGGPVKFIINEDDYDENDIDINMKNLYRSKKITCQLLEDKNVDTIPHLYNKSKNIESHDNVPLKVNDNIFNMEELEKSLSKISIDNEKSQINEEPLTKYFSNLSMHESEQGDVNVDNDEEENNSDIEILLDDANHDVVKRVITIAPGQNECPAPWLNIPDIDDLSFPKIFGGHAFDHKRKLTYGKRVKLPM